MIAGGRTLLADAHVHFYPCFDRDAFLSAAAANLEAAATSLGASAFDGFLLLTEGAGERFFTEWRAAAARAPTGRWRFSATSEEEVLLARDPRGRRLALVAGRQVVSREGLEVLALGTLATFPRGLGFEEALDAAREAAPLVVIPWGFGKWWLRRGERVAAALDRLAPGEIYLGDNGGRPALAPRPTLFRRAEARGVGILPGSDPLPFPGQAGRAGRVGFAVEGARGEALSWAALLRALRSDGAVRPFGRYESIPRFLRNQAAMQLVKRRRPPVRRERPALVSGESPR